MVRGTCRGRPVEPDKFKRWIAFLRSHKDGIATMNFFTAPTASLRVVYVLFFIEHARRELVHSNALNAVADRPSRTDG